MNIYIACALTHVPGNFFKEYTNFIHEMAGELKTKHKVNYALINSDPQLAAKPDASKSRICYLWDRNMVEESDLVIAECSFPSTGMGIELQIAENKDIPVILCYRDYGINKSAPISYVNPDHSSHDLQIGEGYVSHMVLGLPSIFEVICYGTNSDGINRICEAVSLIENACIMGPTIRFSR